jgi:ABC-2 type transport system ATP-binding protein
MTDTPVLQVDNLVKTFKIGFARKVVHAVRGISLEANQGEIFGFLGPNGAGKTTTIKMCTDLIRPSSGTIRLFGKAPSSAAARGRLGYLPEQPYFYDYLKPEEILDFFGKLYGLSSTVRKKRTEALLDQVGLGHARGRTLRKFSKGMLQRVGLAQALISEPDLVILDEPLSGLDPIGRKELKDIISSLKNKGTTVFFSSHILADIELLCDKIAIIDQGKLKYTGPTRELIEQGHDEVEIIATGLKEEFLAELESYFSVQRFGETVKMVGSREHSSSTVTRIIESGGKVRSVIPRSETLEEIFVKTANKAGGSP